jgi:hypothetical protein
MGKKKKTDSECKLCKSAHPFCDGCCNKCENTCNTNQVCRLEPVKTWGPESFAAAWTDNNNGGNMTDVQTIGQCELVGELTTGEKKRFDELCGVVDRGIKAFFEVGMALAEIRESRLYRETHDTFENFCRERWDIGKNYANYQISAYQVVKNLNDHNCGQIIPLNEAQARPLSMFEADDQIDIWNMVLEKANENNGKITASLVSSVVAEYLRKSVKEKLEDRKTRISRESLIAPKFKDAVQSFVDVISETINNGFKETSREAVLRHIDAVRELVAYTKG